jgi:hypothetical protein
MPTEHTFSSLPSTIRCPRVSLAALYDAGACDDWLDAFNVWAVENFGSSSESTPTTITPIQMKDFLLYARNECMLDPEEGLTFIARKLLGSNISYLHNKFWISVDHWRSILGSYVAEGPYRNALMGCIAGIYAIGDIRGWDCGWEKATWKAEPAQAKPAAAAKPEPEPEAGWTWLRDSLGNISIFGPSRNYHITPDHSAQERIIQNLILGQYQEAAELADRREAVKNFLDIHMDGIQLKTDRNGEVLLNDQVLPEAVAEKALNMIDAGINALPLLRFLKRSQENPDPAVHEQLLQFVAANDFHIDQDGFIVAWKKVSEDMKDLWTRSLDYSPPRTVVMPREAVVADPDEACAAGLHFATWRFTYNYTGSRVVELRVDPANVVSVPKAHVDKARASSFQIVREVLGWKSFGAAVGPAAHNGGIHPAAAKTENVTVSKQ